MDKIYPFKFLDSYSRDDKDMFFGRDEETQALYDMVFQTDILMVYGPSGSGKSSLIQCGLANRFESHDWLELNIRRGSNLNVSFSKALFDAGGSNAEVFAELDWLDESEDEVVAISKASKTTAALLKKFRAIYHKHFRPIYLIFDQFEELFILGSGEEQATFIKTVSEVLTVDQPVTMIFSMREEYLGYLFEFEKAVPQLLRKKLRVEPMNLDKVRQVMGGINSHPQSLVTIKTGEIDEVAEGVFEKIRGKERSLTIQLPYMQVFLDKLYLDITDDENRETEAEFSLEALSAIGDIEDVLRDFLEDQVRKMHLQLSDRYGKHITEDTIWNILSPFATLEGTKQPNSRQSLIYRFETGEVLPSQYKNFDKTKLTAIADDAVLALVQGRILRFSEEEELYEIVHDSLAKRIAEKRSEEEVTLLEVQRLIRSQTSVSEDARELFSKKQLNFIAPFLSRLELSTEELILIDESYKEVDRLEKEERKRQRKKRERVIWNLMFLLITILLGVAIVAAVLAFNNSMLAKKNERLALVNAEFAKRSEEEALLQKGFAELNEQEALKQKGIAEANEKDAIKQQEIAELSKIEAIIQKGLAEKSEALALENEEEAKKQADLALLNEGIAKRQKEIAEVRRMESQRLSRLAKSRTLAFKATQYYRNTQLNGLLALESYLLNERNDNGQNPRDPDIYEALRSAIVKLDKKSNVVFRSPRNVIAFDFNDVDELSVLNDDGMFRSFNIKSKERIKGQQLSYKFPINRAFVYKSQGLAVMGYEDKTTVLWDLTKERITHYKLKGVEARLRASAISPDSRYLATGGRDQAIRIWKLQDLGNNPFVIPVGSSVRSLAYSSDGKNLISGDEKGRIIVWSGENFTSNILDDEGNGRRRNISSEIISDGDKMAVGYSDGLLKIIDTKTLKVTHILSINESGIEHIAISESAGLIAVATSDATIKVYALDNMSKRPVTIYDHRQKIDGLAFNDLGQIFALCRDNTIRFWETDLSRMSKKLCVLVNESMSLEEWQSEVSDTEELPYDSVWIGERECVDSINMLHGPVR